MVCDGCDEDIEDGTVEVYEGGDLIYHQGCDIGCVEDLVRDPTVEDRPVWRASGTPPTLHADPDCFYLRQADDVYKRNESQFTDSENRCGRCWPGGDDGDD